MSVDHHQIWRRHLAWSLRDGDHLRNAVTSRFASNMVFMSLLLGTEIGVLFSPSKPADTFRAALKNENYSDPNFWAAIVLCLSIGLTLSTLVANFTAWAIIGAVSPQNSHAILRSSVGLDAAQLPARLVILSIYCFVAWVVLFIWILVPHVWGYVIAIFPIVLIAYIVTLYSSFGRLVIYSRAMQQHEIFEEDEDNHMSSTRLFEELLKLAEKEKGKQSPLPLYYRSKKELHAKLSELRHQEQEDSVDMGFESAHASQYVSKILDSSGHQDLQLVQELSKSYDEEMDYEHKNGREQRPQNEISVDDLLESSPHNNEGSDTCGPLDTRQSSSRNSRSGRRRGYNSDSDRRGYSDSESSSRLGPRGERMNKSRGTSIRSQMENNPGGASTISMTF